MKSCFPLASVALVAILGLITTGCNKDTGQTNVKYDPEQSRMEDERKAQEQLNDPNIPEATKQMIRGRLAGKGALGQAGQASAQAGGKSESSAKGGNSK